MKDKKAIFNYLDKNSYKDKSYLIRQIKGLGYSEDNAIKIYYSWKSKFMKTKKCIPSFEKEIKLKPNFKTINNLIIGEYGEYKKLDNCLVVGNHFFNNILEIEGYRNFRIKSNLKSIDDILDEAIEVMELVGLN